jgi:hypothetical protein
VVAHSLYVLVCQPIIGEPVGILSDRVARTTQLFRDQSAALALGMKPEYLSYFAHEYCLVSHAYVGLFYPTFSF